MRKEMNRRVFIKNGAMAAAGAIAAPSFIPSSAFGANEKISVALIGTGRRGAQLLNDLRRGVGDAATLVAVSDPDTPTAHEVAGQYDAKAYLDYREILERKDVDAVINATPDHWHDIISVHSAQAGKDIYCEKPMSFTVHGGSKVVEAVRKYKVVFQSGSQQRSMRDNYIACMLVRNGAIGRVKKVISHNYPSPWISDLPGQEVPEGLDWDRWCGPAELVPYHADIKAPRANPGWISFRRFSSGEMGGWGSHGYDQIQWALGTDDTAPVEIWADDEEFDPPVFTSPGTRREGESKTSIPKVYMKYASGIVIEQGDARPGGGVIIGEEGTIKIDRGSVQSDPYPLAAKVRADLSMLEDMDVQLIRSDNHMRNWVDCIKSREDPVCNVESGHHTSVLCHFGNIARMAGRRLKYDPKAELFIDDDDANKFLDVERRAGYEMPEEV